MFRFAFGVLFWVLVSPRQPCAAQTYVYPPDAAILLEAKAAWGGDSVLPSWNASQPCEQWEGVNCDDAGRPTSLELPSHGLSGSLPSSIGNLTTLQYLHLSSNQLNGSIPSSIGNLLLGYYSEEAQRLTPGDLDLSRNALSGSIPSSIGEIDYLGLLDLSSNQLSGSIPSDISKLENLGELDLSSNQLSGPLPSSIGNVNNLVVLNFSSNQLSGSIPSSIGDFLYSLDLSHNQLSGSIPSSVGNWVGYLFNSLDLSYNQLSGSIPSNIVELLRDRSDDPTDRSLYLQSNRLTGPLPRLPPRQVLTDGGGYLNIYNFSDNFLSGRCPSKPLDPAFYGNCFKKCADGNTTKLRNETECSKACGSDKPTGPCSGKGTCSISGTNETSTCVCKRGFVSPSSNPGTCVLAPPPPPSPPPDLSKLCAGAVTNPKKCRCPRGGRCQPSSLCDNKYVCRCLGVRPKSVRDPKTGILKQCLRRRRRKL